MSDFPTLEQFNAKHLDTGIQTLVRRLRDLADRVERQGDLTSAVAGQARYVGVVANIQHEITWGFANLNADNLLRSAVEADVARASDNPVGASPEVVEKLKGAAADWTETAVGCVYGETLMDILDGK